MSIMVVGAGIGGLTAAIALRRAGIEATAFERAGDIKEVGAGILLAANAMTAFRDIGLAEEIGRLGEPASAIRIRSWRGKTLAYVPPEVLEKRVGAPSIAVHRADLQVLLLRRLGEEHVRLGAKCVGFENDGEGARAAFADGSEESGDALIGADGLHSTVRTRLFGPQKPRFAGYTAWRGIVEPDRDLLPHGTVFESWGRGARFGCTHIGGGRIYWFAVRNTREGEKVGPAGSPYGPGAALLELFGGWHPPVPELIAETAENAIRRDDIYDREPLYGPWGEGCVTLLGDAAHPMTPNLGQGACQAVEDATMLAYWLEKSQKASVPSALRRYENLRRERTSWIVRRSRAFGRVGQIENPLLCRLRDVLLELTTAAIPLRQFERVMRYQQPREVH